MQGINQRENSGQGHENPTEIDMEGFENEDFSVFLWRPITTISQWADRSCESTGRAQCEVPALGLNQCIHRSPCKQ